MQACQNIYQGDPHFGVFTWTGPCDTHQSADRLDQEIVAWQLRTLPCAESGYRAIDQIRPYRPQYVIAQPESFHRSGTAVFDNDICAGDQIERTLPVSRLGEVEYHRALIAVHRIEIRGHAGGIVKSARTRSKGRPSVSSVRRLSRSAGIAVVLPSSSASRGDGGAVSTRSTTDPNCTPIALIATARQQSAGVPQYYLLQMRDGFPAMRSRAGSTCTRHGSRRNTLNFGSSGPFQNWLGW